MLASNFAICLRSFWNTFIYNLENIKLSSVGTVIEKCLLAREVIENIGDPLESEYARWNQGVCNQFDVNFERTKIENQLITKYGSVSVYGD